MVTVMIIGAGAGGSGRGRMAIRPDESFLIVLGTGGFFFGFGILGLGGFFSLMAGAASGFMRAPAGTKTGCPLGPDTMA